MFQMPQMPSRKVNICSDMVFCINQRPYPTLRMHIDPLLSTMQPTLKLAVYSKEGALLEPLAVAVHACHQAWRHVHWRQHRHQPNMSRRKLALDCANVGGQIVCNSCQSDTDDSAIIRPHARGLYQDGLPLEKRLFNRNRSP